MDGAALAARRDAESAGAAGAGSTSDGNGPKTESVVKMFMDEDKIKAIKARTCIVTVGTPATEVVIRPLSTAGMVAAFKSLRHLLVPVLALGKSAGQGAAPTISAILDAFGDNIEDVPELVTIILQRGNPDIDRKWVDKNLDILLDLQVIIPPFLEQNGLDRMFSGKLVGRGVASSPASAQTTNGSTTVPSQQTAESPAESTSAPTTTDSQPITSGTN